MLTELHLLYKVNRGEVRRDREVVREHRRASEVLALKVDTDPRILGPIEHPLVARPRLQCGHRRQTVQGTCGGGTRSIFSPEARVQTT